MGIRVPSASGTSGAAEIEDWTDLGNLGAAETIAGADDVVRRRKGTLDQACTVTINLSANQQIDLALAQDATGGRLVTWVGVDSWKTSDGNAPILATAANAVDRFYFEDIGGTTYGYHVTENSAAVQLISSTTLGADAASIDLQSIPQTFKHLRIVLQARGSKAATDAQLRMRFNNVSATEYTSQYVGGVGTTNQAASALTTSGRIGDIPAASASAGFAGPTTIEVPNYTSTTFTKQAMSLSYFPWAGADGSTAIRAHGFSWFSTIAAVNRITLFPDTGDFKAGTVCSLYGIKG